MTNILIKLIPDSEEEIDALSMTAFKQVIKLMSAGMLPKDAIKSALSNYSEDVISSMAKSFSKVLDDSIGTSEMKTYKVGNVTLSNKLYENSKQVSTTAKTIIEEHLKGFHDVRKLTLQMFEGYHDKGYGKADIFKPTQLPKYLQRLLGDAYSEADLMFAKAQVETLVTPHLKASYMDVIDRIQKSTGKKVLEQKLKVAIYEKSRYLSNRIATTELTRAYNQRLIKELPQDIEYVQIRASFKHAHDLCDLYLKPNTLGLGAGVYRAGEAPVPPYHSRCLCVLHQRLDLQDLVAKDRQNAARDFFTSLSEEERKLVLSNPSMRKAIEDGMPVTDVLNTNTPKDYKIKTVGDIRNE